MAVSAGRCGFTLEPEGVDPALFAEFSDPDAWYQGTGAFSCCREPWADADTDRCIWHAEVEGKLPDVLGDPPVLPERLDGAFLKNAELGDRLSFADCSLIGANFSGAGLSGSNLSGAYLWGADFSGASFSSETDLSGADLRFSNLSGADLSGVDFSGANLWKANLAGATLFGTKLSDAFLLETNLSDAISRSDAILSGAYLEDADLSGVDLSGKNLSGAYLEDADLSGANLEETNLSGATLTGATLSDVSILYTDLSGVYFGSGRNLRGMDLGGVDLSDAWLEFADLSGANLEGTNLSGAFLWNANLAGADLQLANISGAYAGGANLTGAQFGPGTNLSGVDLHEADLSEAWLGGVDLSYADLSEANLSDAEINEANLSGANLSDADLSEADLTWADLSNADLRRTTVSGTDFTDANLSGADFSYLRLSPGDPPILSSVGETEDTRFDFGDFSGVEFRNHDFTGATFRQTDFSEADLYRTDFGKADLRDAVLDQADCRQARFEYADLEGASLIECDLRSAKLDGANLYHAVLTENRMNLSTTVSELFCYPRYRTEERSLRPLLDRVTSTLERKLGLQPPRSPGTREYAIRTFEGREVDRRLPWGEQVDLSEWLERRAWSHRTVHRQLITHGRIRQALHEKHYLREQEAKRRRARLEMRRAGRRLIGVGPEERTETRRTGDMSTAEARFDRGRDLWSRGRRVWSDLAALLWAFVSVLNLRASERLIRMSESPLYVGRTILTVAVGFAFLVYPFVGNFQSPADPVQGAPPLAVEPPTAWQLFVFSLATFLEGTYLILEETLDTFLPFEQFEPAGVSVTALSGVEPVGLAAQVAWAERLLGALLVVPFALLVVQRVRLYFGAAVSEEGLGGGLLSWLLNR